MIILWNGSNFINEDSCCGADTFFLFDMIIDCCSPQGERKISVLVVISIILMLHVIGIYWWYRNDDLLYPLVMFPPKSIPPFWHAIFIIMVNGNLLSIPSAIIDKSKSFVFQISISALCIEQFTMIYFFFFLCCESTPHTPTPRHPRPPLSSPFPPFSLFFHAFLLNNNFVA